MTIRRQMILLIGLPTLLIYVIIVGGQAVYQYRQSRVSVEREATRLAASYAARFDGRLREAQRVADGAVIAMESVPEISDEQVFALLERNVLESELVYGACMAFEPGIRKPPDTLFAPYVYRGPDGLRRMNIDNNVYDWYRDPQYTWYSQPKALGKAVWSEPYFDEGAGNVLMTTFSAPFQTGETFGGVTTVDINLPALNETIGKQYEEDVDFVILNKDARFVYHPDDEYIMSESMIERAEREGNAALVQLARQMLSKRPGAGSVEHWDGLHNQMVFYAPIQSAEWVFAVRVPESIVLADVRRRTLWSGAALAAGLPLVLASIFLVSRRLTKPISKLRDKVGEVAGGDLSVTAPEQDGAAEIRHLAQSFNNMTSQLRVHIDRVAEERSARMRVERDLDIARDIQRSLLPSRSPELSSYEIAGWSQSAAQTGGDYYDWQTLPGGPTLVTLADVSGHGIGPALVTAVCRAYARASFSSLREFSPVIETLNDLLVADLPSGRFVTLVAVLINPASDGVEVISAGHGPVLQYISETDTVVTLDSTNLPLGLQQGLSYAPAEKYQLNKGDFLILLTDGFLEWIDSEGRIFGAERLKAAVREAAHRSSGEIIQYVYEQVRKAVGEAPQNDDLTAVVIKRAAL